MASSTACFMIVSRNDIPIYEAEVGAAVKKEDAAYQHQFILHAALDIVQDLAWTTSAMFLKAIDRRYPPARRLWISSSSGVTPVSERIFGTWFSQGGCGFCRSGDRQYCKQSRRWCVLFIGEGVDADPVAGTEGLGFRTGVPGGESPERRLEKLQVQAATDGLREIEQAATRVFFISGAGKKIPNRAQWTVHWATKCPAEISGFFRREGGGVAGFGGRSCRRGDFGEDEPHLRRPRAGASRCVSGDYGARKKNLGQFSGVAVLRSVFGIA
ncbi:hypothetical protein U1Q18_006693 [Sarracenia purpurea var. burkii]